MIIRNEGGGGRYDVDDGKCLIIKYKKKKPEQQKAMKNKKW